jgi:RNA polymerase sigma factor (sigma-70 family)
MNDRIRTEENHLARRIIQHETMSDTSEEIGERIALLLPRLRRFARSLSRNQHDADDLVQTAVERAWRHLDQLRPGANLASWMFGIMKNAWLDNLRTRRSAAKSRCPKTAANIRRFRRRYRSRSVGSVGGDEQTTRGTAPGSRAGAGRGHVVQGGGRSVGDSNGHAHEPTRAGRTALAAELADEARGDIA